MHRRLVIWLAVAVVFGGAAAFVAQTGLRPYVVRTGSMSPTIAPGDAVLDTTAGHPALRRGQVVTFRLADGALVTHRILTVHGQVVTTKGDANRTADPWTVAPNHVIGRVRHTLPRIGYALVYLQQPTGVGSLMSAILVIFFAWQLFFGSGPQPTARLRRKASQNLVAAEAV